MLSKASSEVAGKKNIQKQHVHKQMILFTAWYMHIYMQLKYIIFTLQVLYTGIVLYTNALENQRLATTQKVEQLLLFSVINHLSLQKLNTSTFFPPHQQDLGEVLHFLPDLQEPIMKNDRKTKRIISIPQKQDNLVKPHCAWVSSKWDYVKYHLLLPSLTTCNCRPQKNLQ